MRRLPIIMLTCVFALCTGAAHAQEVVRGNSKPTQSTASKGTDATLVHTQPGVASVPLALWVARLCWVEADFSLTDCAAITYVLRARARTAGWPLIKMLWRYGSLDADTPRAALARRLPIGPYISWSAGDNDRWLALQRVAALALRGRIRNPAPHARHWGSRSIAIDVRRAKRALAAGRWAYVPSATVNAFFALRGRQ